MYTDTAGDLEYQNINFLYVGKAGKCTEEKEELKQIFV